MNTIFWSEFLSWSWKFLYPSAFSIEIWITNLFSNFSGQSRQTDQTGNYVDYHFEASEYEKKLIQVAEMHGELLEFNEHLQKVLHSKDNRIRKLRLDLVDLRGPLPAEESGIIKYYFVMALFWILVTPNRMPLTAWKHTERNRDKKSIYNDFMRFSDSSTWSSK